MRRPGRRRSRARKAPSWASSRSRRSTACRCPRGTRRRSGAGRPCDSVAPGGWYTSGSVSVVLPLAFPVLAVTALVSVPLYAWRVRGRGYAIFGLIILAIALPGALFMHRRLAELMPAAAPLLHVAFAYGMAAACTHLLGLVQARLRPRAFRWAISIPGMAFIATGALSGLWLLALLPIRGLCLLAGWTSVLQALRWLDLAPFVLGIASVMTSLRTVEEIVRIPLDRAAHPSFTRLPVERRRPAHARAATKAASMARPLRVVQITDPHLGPWQPVHRL